MKQRGRPRKTYPENPLALIERVERPRAPRDLTEQQKRLWTTIVSSMAADWFPPATLPLLAQYCRHCTNADQLAAKLRSAPGDLELYGTLLTLQKAETAAMISLGRALRLTQHSVTNHLGHRTVPSGPKPWEIHH
jgi:hypothetical protein